VSGGASLVTSWRRAQLAELVWLGDDGRPDAATVVPLLLDSSPAVAMTYHRLVVARAIAGSSSVVLAVATPSVAGGSGPVTAAGRVVLEQDPTGARFEERLLDQELAKCPPSRRRAESLLLRREHWWYLPRLLLTATRLGPTRTHPARDALAAVATAAGLHVTTVDVDDDQVTSRLPDGPAVVLRHGARVPDLEHRWVSRWLGEVVGGRFAATMAEHLGSPTRPPGVVQRWREEVALERGCRAGLAAARAPRITYDP
jgi:hypothetical protein